MITKTCFICHGRGHHLSHKQVQRVKEECTDKKGRVNWNCVENHLKQPNAVCELCHGEKTITYLNSINS